MPIPARVRDGCCAVALEVNWDAVGALAELAGAVGVVLTLVYLSAQIRQNTRSMDESRRLAIAQTFQERARMTMDLNAPLVASEAVARVLAKVSDDPRLGWNPDKLRALGPDERVIFNGHMTRILAHLDNVHYQFEQGYILDAEGHRLRFALGVRHFLRVIDLPDIRFVVTSFLRPAFYEDFMRVVNELRRERDLAPVTNSTVAAAAARRETAEAMP